MAKYLVVVESPAKAKTIRKFLGNNYRIEASMGHVRDLPKSQMGVDIERDFEPKYITIRGKGPILDKIRKTAREADRVLLATDPDREGEAISWHLAYILDIDKDKPCRIEFNEITKDAVKNAVKNPRPINMDLVDAQQARRILDRLVGYNISPLLWKKVRKGLSAGRVQSVAVRLICDREEEIERFKPEEYWKLIAHLYKDDRKNSFEAELLTYRGKKLTVVNKEQMDEVLEYIKTRAFVVGRIKRGTKTRSPYPPYNTSSLQQDAYNRFGFSAKRTMMAAQQLYEGIDIKGEGLVGLITYMRTDSVRIAQTALEQVREFIAGNWEPRFLPSSARYYKGKKSAQDAHEAIRPTSVTRTPERVKASLNNDQYKLYSLIWKRFVACQMANAEYSTMSADIECGEYGLKTSGSVVTFKGFLEVYDNEDDKKQKAIPELVEGQVLKVKKLDDKQLFTQPPARYTEASLIKTLEEDGIGRPSTYAPIISTIMQRGYVEREQKALKPTYLGKVVNDVMKEYFKDIVDVDFTAEMERKLDQIEEEGRDWKGVVKEFYIPLHGMIERAEEEMAKVKLEEQQTDEVCELCGRNMVIKHGRFGQFLACPGFPECKNTKPILQKVGVKCPKCAGEVVVKHTKKGRTFYGCSSYPNCDFMTWNKPSNDKCTECGNTLWEKKSRKGATKVCLNPGCIVTKTKDK